MTRRHRGPAPSGRSILLVDDDQDYLEVQHRLLEREGHKVVVASNGMAALKLLEEAAFDLVLLDYRMPGMTGEEVVTEIRRRGMGVQVVLQTGYATERPPLEMMRRLDIQGYHSKGDGPENFLLWTEVGLRFAATMRSMERSRDGLRHILAAAPDLHRIQPLDDLLQGILLQVAGLCDVEHSLLAVLPAGPVESASGDIDLPDTAEPSADEQLPDLRLRAGTGRWETLPAAESRDSSILRILARCMAVGRVVPSNDGLAVPLLAGHQSIGALLLEGMPSPDPFTGELVELFARQAAVAIQNVRLYEMATLDTVSGVFTRSFFDQWLVREVRAAFRFRHTVSLLVADLDGFRRINDEGGHRTGDAVLASVGRLLRSTTREQDIVARLGGDEFAVVLPQSGEVGARSLGSRLLASAPHLEPRSVRLSIGVAVLEPHDFSTLRIPTPMPHEYFERMSETLLQAADDLMYLGKHQGGNTMRLQTSLNWEQLPSP